VELGEFELIMLLPFWRGKRGGERGEERREIFGFL